MSGSGLNSNLKSFLGFLHNNRGIRAQIKASRDQGILYCGVHNGTPAYQHIEQQQKEHGLQVQTLKDVTSKIPMPSNMGGGSLQEYAQELASGLEDDTNKAILWRALSGIYASNLSGKVALYVAEVVDETGLAGGKNADGTLHYTQEKRMQRKVFTATEVNVLRRNTAIDKLDQETAAELQLQARKGVIEKHITVLTSDHVLPAGDLPTKILVPTGIKTGPSEAGS
jgi:hypothetical protein